MVRVDDVKHLVVLDHRNRISGKIEYEEPDRHSVGVTGAAFPAPANGRKPFVNSGASPLPRVAPARVASVASPSRPPP